MDQFVTIKTFQSLPEAEAARMHLADQGIEAHLLDAEVANMGGHLGNAPGHIKLQVSSDHADQAVTWLEQRGFEWDDAADDERAVVGDRCLECDEPLPAGKSRCSSCGWTYSKAINDASDEDPCEIDGEDDAAGVAQWTHSAI